LFISNFILRKVMRPLVLIGLLLLASVSPSFSIYDTLEESSDVDRSGSGDSGVSISPTSGTMNGGQNLTITGSGFLAIATNNIVNDGLTHSWSTSVADSIQGGYGANAIGVTSDGDVHVIYFNYDTRQLKHAVYDGQSWSRSVIDTASAGSQYRFVELQIDSNDHLHVAHWVTGDYLHYRVYDGSSWNLNYTTSNVDSYGVSLALNSLNHAHIAFSTPGYVCSGLKLAYYNPSNSAFTTINPDSTSTSQYNGCYPSVGIDSNDAVHITYRDHSNSRHNYITNESGPWDKYQLSNTKSPGYYTDLAVESNDDIFIVHRNTDGIRHASGTPGGTWSQGSVYSNNGEETSLSLDVNDNPHVIHWHSSTDDLMYSKRSTAGSWTTVTVDGGPDDTGRRNAVTIDHNHQIHVAYADVGNKQLKYATVATGLVNDYTIDVQFGNFSSATATVLSDTEMYVTTPAASSAGDVALGLWDSEGNYQPLNLSYTYTDANDLDNDGIENSQDDCPNLAGNSTIDKLGCPDYDGDGYSNTGDAFPQDSNEYLDSDNDGVGDNSDAFPNDPSETTDSDNDGVGDNADTFPNDPTETNDSDSDGVGDNADDFPNDSSETVDSDGDGVGDNSDVFPNNPYEWRDSDGDGVGDNADAFPNDSTETTDSDGDGVGDNSDHFPDNAYESRDSDGDGVGDNADVFPNDATETSDSDGDGYGDNSDDLPNNPNEWQDSDGDGIGDNSDLYPNDPSKGADSDGDGTDDSVDAFPNDANETQDSDGDGVGDNADVFPSDPSESVDSDGDGVGDNADAFPNDSSESMDSDGDGVGDSTDAFPVIPTQWSDSDGDGYGDNWGNQSWTSLREQYGIGQYVQGAIRSDYCPEISGTSTSDGYFGCVDDDGDGIANLFEDGSEDSSDDSDEGASALPAVGLIGTLSVLLVAVIASMRKDPIDRS
tara:strand:- start:51 stop:2861 length:2811 start_codon:yes stop_codon:yes gene_type:complete